MKDLYTHVVTVYKDVPGAGQTPRHWVRTVYPHCQVQGEIVDKAFDTVRNPSEAKFIIIKGLVMVSVGDFAVFGNCTDEVTNAQEWLNLQKRKDGMKIKSVTVFANNMGVDHTLLK